MVRAYHVAFTAYGFWLPNDPRGSWSTFVRQWELFRFGGPATTTATRRSVAARRHDARHRHAAKQALRHPPVQFTGEQARQIAAAFGEAAAASAYRIHACAILPEHVHMVVGRGRYRIEQVVRRLKQAATVRLSEQQMHPLNGKASPWARGCWKVFLNEANDIERAARYVEANPEREHKRRQRWSFVVPFGE
ncbi:MAG: transposase [bacterium]